MNLILDPWLPIRDTAGRTFSVAPIDLPNRSDIVELAAVRADFNGALAQFLIGLFQVVAPADSDDYEDVLVGRSAFPSTELRAWSKHFEFDNGGARVMQDLAVDVEPLDLASLLIDAPGGNTLKNNGDLFIKRQISMPMSLSVAAQALICLQINAPAGGTGYRTSLRGGGPVSYLWWPPSVADQPVPLWQKIWANVMPISGSARASVCLPWTAPCITSEGGRDALTTLSKLHGKLSEREKLLLCYFATPRRVRLDFVEDVTCSFTRERGPGVTSYRTQNLGANYLSQHFRHPLSPYYEFKGDFLPQHLTESGFTYLDWPASQRSHDGHRAPLIMEKAYRRSIERWLGARHQMATWAFGYKMDNMKCEDWHEAPVPALVGYPETVRADLLGSAQKLVDAAAAARKALSRALRRAWTDEGKKGETLVAESEFIAATTNPFFDTVEKFAPQLAATEAATAERNNLKAQWQRGLKHQAIRCFEAHAEAGDVRGESLKVMQRIAKAHRQLILDLNSEVPKAMGIDPSPQAAKKPRKVKEAA